MRVGALASSMNIQAASNTTGAPGAGSTSFQTRLATGAGGAPSAAPAGPTGAEILQQASQDMRSMLRLQFELSRGRTSLISNVLKTRHETAKNSIQNIR